MAISVPKNHMLHPGQILQEIYMKDRNYNQSTLAKKLGCTHKKINEIVNGKRGISQMFAIKLADLFSTSPEMWSRLESDYKLFLAKNKVLSNAKNNMQSQNGESCVTINNRFTSANILSNI